MSVTEDNYPGMIYATEYVAVIRLQIRLAQAREANLNKEEIKKIEAECDTAFKTWFDLVKT